MANAIWTGNTGNWSVTSNWKNNAPPAAGDQINFDNTVDANTYTITFNLSTSPTFGTLTLGSGASTGVENLLIGVNGLTPYTLSVGTIFVNVGSIELAGGVLHGGTAANISAGASIQGYGALTLASGVNGVGVLKASGPGGGASGILDVTGSISQSVDVVIDSANASDLKIETSSNIGTALALTSSNQTLEVGSGATVTLTNVAGLSVTGANIVIDGGTLKDTHGITLSSGALSGAGAVTTGTTAGTEFSGGGTVTATGGTLTFNQAVDPTGSTATNFHIANSATLTFMGAVGSASVDPTITFDVAAGYSGFLSLTNTPNGQFFGTVNGFINSDEILVGGSVSDNVLSRSGSDVIVTDGATTIQTINMGTTAAANAVHFSAGSKQILETDAVCFMAGTMIRTPDGEVAVETLQPDDLVLTSDGLAKPVCWLGRQTISTRFTDPLRTWPIRIKAGALAENVPCRDLVLSPDHAVLVESALIHAGALVNDTSIVREAKVPEVFTYYHVELDDHSLVLAENTPAETFVDNVERLAFDNWAEHEALYPDGKPIEELPYPRAKGRRQVPMRIRVALDELAKVICAVEISAVA
jgi:hypothetical protein